MSALAKKSTPAAMREVLDACRRPILWALLFSAGVNILYLAPSLYMMQVYDRVLMSGSVPTLLFLSLALALSLGALASLDGLRSALMTRISVFLDDLLAGRLFALAMQRHDASRRQILREFDTFRQTIAGPSATAIMDAPWSPLYVLICFLLHPLLGLLAALGGALLVGIAMHNEWRQRDALVSINESTPKLYAAQESDQASADAIRAHGMQGAIVERHLEERGKVVRLQAKGAFSGVRHASASKFVRLGLQSAALGLGAYLAIEQLISAGAIIAASILISRALAPLEQIVGAWRQIGAARIAWKNLTNALADEAIDLRPRTSLPKPRGELSFEHVSVRLSVDRFALRDLTFAIAPGELVGVLGASGAGKTTLCRVAAGVRRPDIGQVRLDSASLIDWRPEELGASVGYVPQDLGLLGGTIADNIRRFGRGADTDALVVAAAKACGAHEMILRLPHAYETELAPGGRGLSFGQAQRVAIARALYNNPALLILDEPNAHLDAEGEARLMDAIMMAKRRGAAILLVVHRLGLLAQADKLLALVEGRLDAFETREEMLRRLKGRGASEQTKQPERAQG